MSRKRRATGHQRQIRGFAVFFGGLAVILVVVVLWLMNRPRIPGN